MANRDVTPAREVADRYLWAPFTSFRRELDRLFDDFLMPDEARFLGAMPQPRIEFKETDLAYSVTAELPGMERKDVQLEIRDDILIISGEKREEKIGDEHGRHYTERTYGHFERRLPLYQDVDSDKIEAQFKNGLLTIKMPKSQNAHEKSRRIEISAQ